MLFEIALLPGSSSTLCIIRFILCFKFITSRRCRFNPLKVHITILVFFCFIVAGCTPWARQRCRKYYNSIISSFVSFKRNTLILYIFRFVKVSCLKMPLQSTDSISHMLHNEKFETKDIQKPKSKIVLINGKKYDITDFNHPGKLL